MLEIPGGDSSGRQRAGRLGAVVAVLLLLLLGATPGAGRVRSAGSAAWQPGELLLEVASGFQLQTDATPAVQAPGAPALQAALATWHLTRAALLDAGSRLYRVFAPTPGLDVPAAAAALRTIPAVVLAEPDYRLQPALVPDDPLFTRQWYLERIGAPAAWDSTTGSGAVTVALVDTGIAAQHPDLAGRVVPGYNFVADTTDTADDNGHGTYTAGLVGAAGNNGVGVAGVAWGVHLMPVKILDSDGAGNVGDFARGIRWATDHGARIINVSAGLEYPSGSMHQAVQYAVAHGVLVVASSGNSPDGTPRYPAGFAEVLAVGATDEADHVAPFSSFGSYVDLSAPGTNMVSTSWGAGQLGFEWASGTSSAAPLVSGAAALLWSVRPTLSPAQVIDLLERGADDLGAPGRDPYYGVGRLNIARSLRLLGGGTPTPAPPAATPTRPPATPTGQAPGTPAPPAGAGVSVTPAHALPGASVTVVGRGYRPGEFVGLRLTDPGGANHELGTAQAGPDGTFSQVVQIPPGLGAGTGTVLALGGQSSLLASTPLGVDATAGGAATATPGPPTGARIEGTISGVALGEVQIYLQVGTGVRDWRYGETDPRGFYHFDNLPAGNYTVGLHAKDGIAVPPPVSVDLDGAAGTVRVIDFQVDGGAAPVDPPAPDAASAFAAAPDPGWAGVRYFAPVQHTLRSVFLAYWQAHGGLPIFGYPLSEEFVEVSPTDGKPYRVQYFERNRFEYHPEFAGTGSVVELGLLGRAATAGRSFTPVAPSAGDATHLYFPPTEHRLGGAFLAYWQAHGGLAVFGYPISEEFPEVSPTDGQPYTVQYFERNRFEYHPAFAGTPNAVELGLLGVAVARAQGFLP